MLVPFLYVQLKLKYRAYNTAAAHLRAIQAFYIYAESRSLNVDEAILACRFESILALLDGYVVWLLSGRQADNISARIGAADSSLFPRIDLRTRDQYLRLLGSVRKVGAGRIAAMIGWRPPWQGATNSRMQAGS